jgi:hypothetical protein
MFMRLAHNSNRLLKLLSATVVTTFFLCQVIGMFCPIVLPTVEAQAMAQESHAGHGMAEDSLCQDSLVSPGGPFGIRPTAFLATGDLFLFTAPRIMLVPDELAWVLPGSRPLLFRLLSTFRI